MFRRHCRWHGSEQCICSYPAKETAFDQRNRGCISGLDDEPSSGSSTLHGLDQHCIMQGRSQSVTTKSRIDSHPLEPRIGCIEHTEMIYSYRLAINRGHEKNSTWIM